MTKSLKSFPPKKSACDPETHVCMHVLKNDPCDYYEQTPYTGFLNCIHQGIIMPMYCVNKQAWPKKDQA
jgi:hypothetical protein